MNYYCKVLAPIQTPYYLPPFKQIGFMYSILCTGNRQRTGFQIETED